MAKNSSKTDKNFNAEAVSVFVAPDAPKAVVVRNNWEGDYVFLLNDVPVEYIDIPDGYIDTEAEILEAREVLDKLHALKAKVPEDQRDDLQWLIDLLAADVQYAEACLSDIAAAPGPNSAEELSEMVKALTAQPRDPSTGRFVAQSH